jgi:DNA-binding NarL/FixJ family response regulator
VQVVHSAVDGLSLLPVPVVRYMAKVAVADDEASTGSVVPLSPAQLNWLRCLAGGGTVAALARSARYSERDRLLNGIYRALGVRARTQAIVQAVRLVLVDCPDGDAPRVLN